MVGRVGGKPPCPRRHQTSKPYLKGKPPKKEQMRGKRALASLARHNVDQGFMDGKGCSYKCDPIPLQVARLPIKISGKFPPLAFPDSILSPGYPLLEGCPIAVHSLMKAKNGPNTPAKQARRGPLEAEQGAFTGWKPLGELTASSPKTARSLFQGSKPSRAPQLPHLLHLSHNQNPENGRPRTM